jgi:DNA repair ATPase RecN
MANTIEMAALGYKQGAREKETRRTPTKASLSKVKGELHYDYAQLLESPPTKQEARFLSKDMQTLLQDLEYADKGMQAIPGIEHKIKNIESQMYQAMADKNPDKYNNLELSLRNEQKALDEIRMKVGDTIRAAKAYHEHNPQDIAKSRDMLKTLRTELSSPYSYSEAKDNLSKLTKPVAQWLDDLRDKGSLDDRILAQNVLKGGNVDYKSILNEAERQGLSLTERAMAEQRDKEAGTKETSSASKETSTASTETPQKGGESPGE